MVSVLVLSRLMCRDCWVSTSTLPIAVQLVQGLLEVREIGLE